MFISATPEHNRKQTKAHSLDGATVIEYSRPKLKPAIILGSDYMRFIYLYSAIHRVLKGTMIFSNCGIHSFKYIAIPL